MHVTLSKILRTGGNIIFLAALYYLTGRAGLLLAVPPGYATVFWPASGFALAMVYLQGYKILPGVWIGSFLINFTTYYAITPPEQHHILFLNACVIGLGAMLQTFIGTWALRMSIGPRTALKLPREIFLFALYAGPLSCLISCTIGVSTLVLTGSIPTSSILYTWGTWFTGDTLGVLIFAPVIVLIWNESISWARKRQVILPLLILFVVTIALFFWLRRVDDQASYSNFKAETALIENALETQFQSYFHELEAVEAFFGASRDVSDEEFERFLTGAFIRRPDIRGFLWVEALKSDELAAYIAEKQRTNPKFNPFERHDDGKDYPVVTREEHYLASYVVVPGITSDIRGFDFGYESRRRSAMQTARDTGVITASEAIVFAPGTRREATGFLAINPMYDETLPRDTIEERRAAFKGAIVGIFAYESIFTPIAKRWASKGIQIRVHEHDEYGAEQIVYASEGYGEGFINQEQFYKEYYAHFGGRTWDVDIYREAPYLIAHVNMSIWYALAGSLGFTFFVTAFLLSVTGQTAVIEEEVQNKTRELTESNTFLNLIMDHVPDMIFVKNQNLELLSFNEALRKLYRPDMRKDVQGTTARDMHKTDEFAVFEEQDRIAFAEGYSETLEENTDYKGEKRLYLTKKIRFENTDGESFLLGISRDVTKEQEAEKELLRSNKELEEFAYVASHDLKAPLRHVSMSAGFLRDSLKDQLDGRTARLIETMIKGTDRMQDMIESLLAYSRVGRAERNFGLVRLHEVIDQALKGLSVQIDEYDADVILPLYNAQVFGDEALLSRLFQNIIQNALKYSKEGIPPYVVISAADTGAAYEISVADNGIGIAPEYADKIFQIFQRLHRDNEYDGVGIGLSICQRIVEFHKGRIWLDKEYTGGTCFKFTLPKPIEEGED